MGMITLWVDHMSQPLQGNTMKTQVSTGKSKSSVEIKARDYVPTKVLVRGLPPSLTAEQFIEEVEPLADHNYFNFVQADKSLGQYAFCKAFINFKNADDLFLFRERFDNYVFVDTRGNEYPAVVEFAPYQKVPLRARKPDHRENTLDEDSDYKKFLENLENPEPPPSFTIKEVIEEVDTKARERIAAHNSETPLLAFINKFKVEKRRAQEKLKEERRMRESERKRLKEEERRLRRDRDRREMVDRERRDTGDRERKESDTSKHKDVTVRSSTSSATSDRRQDTKKLMSSKNDKPMSYSVKPGTKAASDSKSSFTSKTATDKTIKYSGSSANQKRNDDDIIVRTLPSSKSKASKLAAEKSRPSSAKAQPPASKPTQAPLQKPASAAKDCEREVASPQRILSGKQEVTVRGVGKPTEKSNKYPTRPVTDRTKEQTSQSKENVKTTSKKVGSDKSQQPSPPPVDELADKTASVKLKDRAKSLERSSSSDSSKTMRVTDKAIERSVSVDSTTSSTQKSEITSNSEVTGDRHRATRNTRYKDRPAQAIYNPGAKAAERRHKQQTSTPGNKPE